MLAPYELKQRQSLPYEMKLRFTEVKVHQYVNESGKDCVVQKSGLDSAVLLHFIRKFYPTMPAIYVNTKLENPTVVQAAIETPNCTIIEPDVSFHEVITTHGIPVVSKDVARALSDVQNPTSRNEATRNLRLTGIKRDGTKGKSGSFLPARYHRLINCGFRFSDKCCYYLKHKPAERIHKKMDLAPFVGTLAEGSDKRARAYLKTGCNNFDSKWPVSKPLSIWTRQDVYRYALEEGVVYPECYGDIVQNPQTGLFETTGESNTGCEYCLFGIFRDPARIERLKYTQPARYKYCMETLDYKTLLPILFEKLDYEDFAWMLKQKGLIQGDQYRLDF